MVLKEGRVVETRSVERELLEAGRIFDLRGRGDFETLAASLQGQGHGADPIRDGLRVTLAAGSGIEAIFAVLDAHG